ncbi:glycosyltransferase family 2 protein [Rhodoblastus acidophilus]|uniref:Glycosyltransferase family 2 protein n=1 Tax=Candidatus Rhodoblastus alkanivorans TaxID=2954117 RepID=A0ABS9Z7X4_9HYPH|nr:glycosyltransferase family A protein [Candidatus Rhodoblastus alkanivorans]MCI4677907.1 glycosyltransferase family 2 protein [Candidatus Rhodoblastus alkanivorans]MCI4683803.1 glycosyltransferase family 2 protein [Candidatus Rhodoblastus alkanivorans]MDI4641121.1 glycosyltransferase family 2 protein [Rhodoblastus acidophilus]
MDISVILNAHHEGLLANPSCGSLELAKAAAEKEGISVEVLVVLDRANAETVEFFQNRVPSDWALIPVGYGDLGHSRNEGVRRARGRWISFLDADDLFSNNWLAAAFVAAENDKRSIAWHPEYDVLFGREEHLIKNMDMDKDHLNLELLLERNLWSALCFARREFLLACPYAETQHVQQIGYEDWSWNMAALGMGAIHKTVPDACHFIRLKEFGSLNLVTDAANCIPWPSDYLKKILVERQKAVAAAGEESALTPGLIDQHR